MLLVVGMAALTVSTSSNTMVQLRAAPEMRGRTMALYFFATSGGRPVGAPALGYLATVFGPRWGMIGAGMAALATAGAGAGFIQWRTRRRAGHVG
jgi:hypothetical protein